MHTTPEPKARPVLLTLAWSAFLACSWTWCIGMFLPALLVRDYGVWGFVLFAVPNVAGAAAMGWVLNTRRSAATLASRHRAAVTLFSTATIGFHVYWLSWIGTWVPTALALDRTRVGIVLALAIVIFLVFLSRTPRGLAAAAVGLLAFSAIVLGAVIVSVGLHLPAAEPARPDHALLWLAPVCMFGFALCPYLDGTFLAVRMELDSRQSRVVFTLGFGLFFAAMILLTYAYAPMLLRTLGGRVAPALIAAPLLAHILLQAGFTVAAHIRCSHARRNLDYFRAGVLLLSALAGVLVRWLAPHAGLDAGELIYRLYMGLYGLVFPAYVWLIVIPTRHGMPPAGSPAYRRMIRVFCAAVGITLPMFWMGLIERQEFWLAPGLAGVLLARLFIPSTKPDARAETAAQPDTSG